MGSAIAFARNMTVFAVDEDNGTLVSIATSSWYVRAVMPVGQRPVALLVMPDERVVIADRRDDSIFVLRLRGLHDHIAERVRIEVAADPVALLFDESRNAIYVASAASAMITVLDATTLETRATIPTAREPRVFAASLDGTRIFVLHLVGGIISVIDVVGESYRSPRTLPLPGGPWPESLQTFASGAGCVSGYGGVRCHAGRPISPELRNTATVARTMICSPDGHRLLVAHTVANTGAQREDVHSVRYGGSDEPEAAWPIDLISVLDMDELNWSLPSVLPVNDYIRVRPEIPDPSAMAVRAGDGHFLVTALGDDSLSELEGAHGEANGTRWSIPGCSGPTAIAVREDGITAILCQFSHTIHVLDLTHRREDLVFGIGEERWSAAVAEGRRLFHRVGAPSSDRGFSCALCHPDGRDDGLVWSSPVGLRQTPWLAGRVHASAPYGWGGEHATLIGSLSSTRARIGARFSALEMSALESYLTQGLDAPSRQSSAWAVEDHVAGERIFIERGCAHCHPLENDHTDQLGHDLGDGDVIDTPSLRFVAASPPYFHDGRYATLEEVLVEGKAGMTGPLSDEERRQLIVYLRGL